MYLHGDLEDPEEPERPEDGEAEGARLGLEVRPDLDYLELNQSSLPSYYYLESSRPARRRRVR